MNYLQRAENKGGGRPRLRAPPAPWWHFVARPLSRWFRVRWLGSLGNLLLSSIPTDLLTQRGVSGTLSK